VSRVFVSYRHEDSTGHAGRLYDRLVQEFGDDDVYRDVDKPRPGASIEERITTELANCDAFVAVVGPAWEAAGPDSWAKRELRMAVERGVPIFVALVGNLGRKDLPAELAAMTVPEVIALPEDYWNEGVSRLLREVRGSLEAEVLAPHAAEVAQALARGRLVVALGTRASGPTAFALSLLGKGDKALVELFAQLPGILRRKGYAPSLTIFGAGKNAELEQALADAQEEFTVIEDAYDAELPLLQGSVLDFSPSFELAATPAVALVELPGPFTLDSPTTTEPDLLSWSSSRALRKRRLRTSLSLQLWQGDMLFFGVGEEDGALADLAKERSSVGNESSWWVAGVPGMAVSGWEQQGATFVDAEPAAYARALRRQVEALTPAE